MLTTRTLIALNRLSSRSFAATSILRNVEPQKGSAEKLTIPVPEGVDKPINPKIDNIVNQIAGLNLLEVSELSSLLKKKLNLPDTAMMPMGGFVAAAPAAKGNIRFNFNCITELVIITNIPTFSRRRGGSRPTESSDRLQSETYEVRRETKGCTHQGSQELVRGNESGASKEIR